MLRPRSFYGGEKQESLREEDTSRSERADMTSEGRKIVAGLGWVSGASYLNRAFGFITTLILARLLAPDQFGAVAVGAMMVDILKIFRDMGLGQALIYRKEESSLANDTALTMILGMNIGLFALALLAAPFVAGFFADPSLTPVLIVMSVNLIPIGLRAVPDALIRREGRFDKLAVPEVVPVLFSSILGIVLAATGYGVWSLVARTLGATVLAAVLIWYFTDYRPRLRFDRAIARELFQYGKFVVGATLLNVALLNIDKAFVGRFGGLGDLGIYTMAWVIASIPVVEFGHLLCKVAFPVFCRVNRDPEQLQRIFLASHTYNALIVAPLGIGLALFGPDLVRLMLGDKWGGIGGALSLLALASFVRAASALLHELLRATGQVRVVQTFTFARLVALAVLGIPALKFGALKGLCLLIFASNSLVLGFELVTVSRTLGITALRTVAPLARAIGTAVAGIGLIWLGYVWIDQRNSTIIVASAIIIASLSYGLLVLLSDRNLLTDARQLFSRG